ncbi:MAG: FecR domain-containing protein [Lachnospiraceae bacterium]|nr:FecR domain-containing protein [Lachnospiraceae bacterium]
MLLQGEGYRSISVEQVTGTVSIVGEKNNGQAYVGEHLYSGDDVTVGDASELTMCMDNDKYVYADANTHFNLQASAANEDSKIKIYLDAGSELNDLQTSLAEGETYEVDTPNSTMSVRGTKFRVTVYVAADGLKYTLLEVTDGQVLARLKTEDGTYNGVERVFTPGQSALIRGNYEFSEFVTSGRLDAGDLSNADSDEDVLMLAYDALPKDGMDRLIALLENGGFIEPEDRGDSDTDEANAETEVTPAPTPTPEPEEQVADNDDTQGEDEGDRPAPVRSLRDILRQGAMAYVVSTDATTGVMTLTSGEEFDPAFYARENPDAVENFGSDPESLLTHYLLFGRNENRPPSLKAALDQEEAFKQFANALDEAYRQEQETSSSGGSSPDNSSSGGVTSYSSGNIDSWGDITLPDGTPFGHYSDGNGLMEINIPNSNTILPFTLNANPDTIDYLWQINWGASANNVSVTYVANSAQAQPVTYTATKVSDNNFRLVATDTTGATIRDDTYNDSQTFRNVLVNLP